MARYDHLPLFKTSYKLCLEVYKITGNFGREYKYTLGEKMKDGAHDILDTVIKTNSLPNSEKGRFLDELFVVAERLKMYARIACDLKIMSPASLGKITEFLEEVEKQTGGWKKWVEKLPVAML